MAKGKKAKIYLTNRAIADLQEIESYTSTKWGTTQAAKYLDAFNYFFQLLESEPGILSPVPMIDSLLTHTVESHIVVCTLWGNNVLVLTIVHSSQDVILHLDRLLPKLRLEVDAIKRQLP
jgi:plasmid stabilization system protein ParE